MLFLFFLVVAQVHNKLEAQYEAKSSADNFYSLITHNAPQLPKHVPHLIHSVEVIGNQIDNTNENGVTLGTIFVWNYVLEGKTVTTKETITAVNNIKRSITYTVFEGELMKEYKSFAITVNITPRSNNRCLVTYGVEYEKANKAVPTPTAVMELLEQMFKDLDAQFHKQLQA